MNISRKVRTNKRILALIAITLFSGLIRIFLIYHNKFPLNDGGMFYSIVEQLFQNNFQFPDFIKYNHLNIPFVYPPLSFYVMAYIQRITQINLMTLFIYLPALLSIFLIPLYYLFSYNILQKKDQALTSTLIFVLLPSSFLWFIAGGGLTRVFGALFALITLNLLFIYIDNKKVTIILLSGIFLGLTFLSHVIWSMFAIYSLISIIVFEKVTIKKKILNLFILFSTAILIVSPWLIFVFVHHTFKPLIDGALSGQQGILLDNILYFKNFVWEGLLPIITVTSLAGLYALTIRKKFLLPLLFGLIFVLSGRALAHILPFIYPLLSSTAIFIVFKPALEKVCLVQSTKVKDFITLHLVIIVIAIHSLLGFVYTYKSQPPAIQSLNSQNYDGMIWAKNYTSRNSNFLIITNIEGWGYEYVAEWFPALSERHSTLTIQASEWTPNFKVNVLNYQSFKKCASLECVYKVIPEAKVQYLYFDNHNSSLYFDAKYHKRYKEAYSNKEVTIYALHQ